MEGLNIPCMVAGLLAGAGLMTAVFMEGGFRNAAFLIAGIVFGAIACQHVQLNDTSRDSLVMLMAMLTGILLVAIPTIIQSEKKAEEEAAARRTTQHGGTVASLNHIYRNVPPSDKHDKRK